MLSWISGDFFAQSPVLVYPMIAMAIFMLVFTGAALRAFLTPRSTLDELARMPLEDEGEVDHE
ncbi:MAG: hypothetical protein PVI30_19850 [Myxococcales bacterium]|jgi:hypothetical protein